MKRQQVCILLTSLLISIHPTFHSQFHYPQCQQIHQFKCYNLNSSQMSQKLTEDPNTKQLNQFVQNMLKQMQERFDEMSSNIIGRVDEMGKRIDDIEKSIGEIMNDLGEEEEHGNNKK